jgi:hypothetical protein
MPDLETAELVLGWWTREPGKPELHRGARLQRRPYVPWEDL